MAHIIADRVNESSTSTSTGPLTLAGAMTGFRAFSAVCAVGDTCYYTLQGVDGTGQPTGEWECGLGTYSSANTLTRTTVTSSSSAGAAVNLSAGTKHVYITMPAVQVKWAREKLTSARTYYVATTGSDSNDGLTVGTPFLTIQKAIDVVGLIDIGANSVTIQLADGTYSGLITVNGPWLGSGTVMLQGNATTPANTLVTSSGITLYVKNGGVLMTQNFKITSTGNFCMLASMTGSISCAIGMDFGACASRQMQADDNGVIRMNSPYTVSASSPIHMQAATGGIIRVSAITVTLSGSPAFATAFASAIQCGNILAIGATFTGSATGKRYNVITNALIDVNGAGATHLPGDVAGTTATGGQYA